MKNRRRLIIALIPFLIIGTMLSAKVSYADVKLNITQDKVEPYSNTKDYNKVIIDGEDEQTPLQDSNKESNYSSNVDNDLNTDKNNSSTYIEDESFKSDVDTSTYESKVDVDNDRYESVIDVDEGDVPGTDSYYSSTFNSDNSSKDDSTNYVDEHYIDKLEKNKTYEIINKDLVVQNIVEDTDNKRIEYSTLPKGTEVKLAGFTNPGTKRYAELQTEDGSVYYENVSSFYNNSIRTNATPFIRYVKSLVNDAKMLGSEKGYISCISFALIYLLITLLIIKFLDTSIFRLKDPNNETYPYINSVARIMPGAMIGSFIIVANMFDSNAVGYYFYEGFSLFGKNYEFIHWIMQIVFIYALYMVWRFILEGFRCFTFPCMIIRTCILLIANIASLYLCYVLSYVGIAIYVLFVLYQCVCVNSYGCVDIGEASEEECDDEGEGESESSEGDEAEPEGEGA